MALGIHATIPLSMSRVDSPQQGTQSGSASTSYSVLTVLMKRSNSETSLMNIAEILKTINDNDLAEEAALTNLKVNVHRKFRRSKSSPANSSFFKGNKIKRQQYFLNL